LDVGVFVRAIVISGQVQVHASGHLSIHQAQKFQELLVPVSLKARPDVTEESGHIQSLQESVLPEVEGRK
jgi:hypothetical protein